MAEAPQRTTKSPGNDGARGAWWTSRWVVALLLAVLVLIFVLENRDPVSIRLLIPVVVMPQWVALLIPLIIGLVIGMLARRNRRR